MGSEGKAGRKLIGKVGDLAHGGSRKFVLRCAESTVEAMLVNYRGELRAYVNRCRHVALSLDWVDNRFFTADTRYLLCANHGALYEPTTGECVWGPCAGKALRRVPLEIEGGKIFARCPDDGDDRGA
ncbi:MAG TPA: Rieske 2Fe-2S domain-containing protein [candidate division Zixibacteria bacterium]|nr:Rieske 2Fe-2S domain-containing protein [candidate division Zixibacteria bacterium]